MGWGQGLLQSHILQQGSCGRVGGDGAEAPSEPEQKEEKEERGGLYKDI